MESLQLKGCGSVECRASRAAGDWVRARYADYGRFVGSGHCWKVILVGLGLLALCLLGFKSARGQRRLLDMWITNSSRLYRETAFQRRYHETLPDPGSVETLLQVSNNDESLVSREFLLEHLQLLQIIFQVKIVHNDRTFGIRDLCQKVRLPRIHYLNLELQNDIEYMMPCHIISPLNCFWDSSKLMQPHSAIAWNFDGEYKPMKIDWRTFDMRTFASKNFHHRFKFFKTLFRDCGIRGGYVDKPCLSVADPYCPNKTARTDVEAVLRGGCFQVAERLYEQPRRLLVGHEGRALQTMLLLRSPADILTSVATGRIYWTESRVATIIRLWTDKMRQTVLKHNIERPPLSSVLHRRLNRAYQQSRVAKSSFSVFTNQSMNDALQAAASDSTLSLKYLIGLGLVTLFLVLQFADSRNLVRSHSWLALAGTGLVGMAIVAGLGLSAAADIPFSILTTQVIPFFMLGFSVDEVLILTSRYIFHLKRATTKVAMTQCLSKALYDSATVLLLTFMLKVTSISFTLLVAVPLTFNFMTQVLLVTVVKTTVMVLLYPCLLHLDLLRQSSFRLDFLCCLVRTSQPPRPRELQHLSPLHTPRWQLPFHGGASAGARDHNQDSSPQSGQRPHRAVLMLVRVLVYLPLQAALVLLLLVTASLGLYSGLAGLQYGLRSASVFPRNSNEHRFVAREAATFGLHTFDVVLDAGYRHIDYGAKRAALSQLHADLVALAPGSLASLPPRAPFWLDALQQWLRDLYLQLRRDLNSGAILRDGSWNSNASRGGLLMLTMLAQDGARSPNYDKVRASLADDWAPSLRDPNQFQVYLAVWRSVDAQFQSLPCVLHPASLPLLITYFLPYPPLHTNQTLKAIPISAAALRPVSLVICKYFHSDPDAPDTAVPHIVKKIRAVLEQYSSEHGIVVVPVGPLFSLSEQYRGLTERLCVSAGASMLVLAAVWPLVALPVLALPVLLLLWLLSVLGMLALLWLYSLPLNAASGVIVLHSASTTLQLAVPLLVAFARSGPGLPPRERLELCLTSTRFGDIDGVEDDASLPLRLALAGLLGLGMLSVHTVDFVLQHFLLVPALGLAWSMVLCYAVLPVLLVHVPVTQPPWSAAAEAAVAPRASKARSSSQQQQHATTAPLSTIPEESGSYRSTPDSASSRPQPAPRGPPSQLVHHNFHSSISLLHPSPDTTTTASTSTSSRGPDFISIQATVKYESTTTSL